MASLRRKISSATDLQSVVRTMKALAISNIGQYEQAVQAVADFARGIDLGLGVCFRENGNKTFIPEPKSASSAILTGVVLFGSDQGLVGRFNEIMIDFALETLNSLPGKLKFWVVGERAYTRLKDSGLPLQTLFSVPNSVQEISLLVREILLAYQSLNSQQSVAEFYLFYNQTKSEAVYAPVCLRLLPLNAAWRQQLQELPWPSPNLPELIGGDETLKVLIREYLFVSLFRAAAESLSSENASRLAAMQRADKNIGDLLESLHSKFNRLRQNSIDDELFDLISGYEALSKEKLS